MLVLIRNVQPERSPDMTIRTLNKLARRPRGGGEQANFHSEGLKAKRIHSALDVIHSLIEWRFECGPPPLGRRVSLLKVPNAGINLTGYHPPRADRRATNFFRQNPRPGDSFSVQNSGPRVEKTKQNPHPRA